MDLLVRAVRGMNVRGGNYRPRGTFTKPIPTNSHAALQLVSLPERPDLVETLESPIGTIRVKKLPKGPATFSVTVDGAAPPEAPAGKGKGQTPRPAGRKKPTAPQQKNPVRKKKAGSVDKARSGKPARHPKAAVRAHAGSKKDKVLALLKRRQGATLKELMKATGWQAHSVRGFLSGTIAKRMGLLVRSEKRDDGERVHSIQE
jgi:hypothetical protein